MTATTTTPMPPVASEHIIRAYNRGDLGARMVSRLDPMHCGRPMPKDQMARLSEDEIGIVIRSIAYDKQTIEANRQAEELADRMEASTREQLTRPAWPSKEQRRRMNPFLGR